MPLSANSAINCIISPHDKVQSMSIWHDAEHDCLIGRIVYCGDGGKTEITTGDVISRLRAIFDQENLKFQTYFDWFVGNKTATFAYDMSAVGSRTDRQIEEALTGSVAKARSEYSVSTSAPTTTTAPSIRSSLAEQRQQNSAPVISSSGAKILGAAEHALESVLLSPPAVGGGISVDGDSIEVIDESDAGKKRCSTAAKKVEKPKSKLSARFAKDGTGKKTNAASSTISSNSYEKAAHAFSTKTVPMPTRKRATKAKSKAASAVMPTGEKHVEKSPLIGKTDPASESGPAKKLLANSNQSPVKSSLPIKKRRRKAPSGFDGLEKRKKRQPQQRRTQINIDAETESVVNSDSDDERDGETPKQTVSPVEQHANTPKKTPNDSVPAKSSALQKSPLAEVKQKILSSLTKRVVPVAAAETPATSSSPATAAVTTTKKRGRPPKKSTDAPAAELKTVATPTAAPKKRRRRTAPSGFDSVERKRKRKSAGTDEESSKTPPPKPTNRDVTPKKRIEKPKSVKISAAAGETSSSSRSSRNGGPDIADLDAATVADHRRQIHDFLNFDMPPNQRRGALSGPRIAHRLGMTYEKLCTFARLHGPEYRKEIEKFKF